MSVVFYLLKLSLKKLALYKLDFLFQILAVFIWISAGLFNIYIINFNFNTLAGWNFKELNLLYAIWALSFGIYNAFGNSILDFDKNVLFGKLDYYLIKPINSLLLITFSKINIMGLGFIIFGLVDTVIAINFMDISIGKVLYLFFTGITGGILIYSILLFFSCFSFFGIKTRQILRTLYDIHKLGQYPFSIYAKPIRIVFGYIIPFIFSNFLPVCFVLNKNNNYLIALACTVLPFIMLFFALWFYSTSLKHYEGAGS